MIDMIRIVGTAGFLVGWAWLIQTAGLEGGGLLATSPRFFLVGAAITGAGVGALLWTHTARWQPARRRA